MFAPAVWFGLVVTFSVATAVAVGQGVSSRRSGARAALDHGFKALGAVAGLTMLLPISPLVFAIELPVFAAASMWFLVRATQAARDAKLRAESSLRAATDIHTLAMMIAMFLMAYQCLAVHAAAAAPGAGETIAHHGGTIGANSSIVVASLIVSSLLVVLTGGAHLLSSALRPMRRRAMARRIVMVASMFEATGTVVMIFAMLPDIA